MKDILYVLSFHRKYSPVGFHDLKKKPRACVMYMYYMHNQIHVHVHKLDVKLSLLTLDPTLIKCVVKLAWLIQFL